MLYLLLTCAAFYAGIQNTLAGGGSFITFPMLLLLGLDPRSANMTSTVALFPCQLITAHIGKNSVSGVGRLSFVNLVWISLFGGACGAVLLLVTPERLFAQFAPWLVLFATLIFAWGSVRRLPTPSSARNKSLWMLISAQTLIALYGGYFGAGIGFLMLAALSMSGQTIRTATATKNVLAMAMNAVAVCIFSLSDQIHWEIALITAVSAICGGYCGTLLLNRIPEKILKIFIISIGICITIGLFIQRYSTH